MTKNTVSGEIMETASLGAALEWDTLLEIQTNIFLPFELSFFFQNKAWQQASSVLDAGCGNGFYLSRLRPFFPNKNFTGLDISPELIKIAQSENEGCDFIKSDYLDYTPDKSVDVILMRLIIQHMIGLAPVLEKTSQLLAPNGRLIIIEPEPKLFFTSPPVPTFKKMLGEAEKARKRQGKNFAVLDTLPEHIESFPGWQVANNQAIIIPKTMPFNDNRWLQMFSIWIDIFERSASFEFDFNKVRKELNGQSHEEHGTYAQIAIRVLELARS